MKRASQEERDSHEARPHCVGCRRPMYSKGPGRFYCAKCGAHVRLNPKMRPRRRDVEGPACRACARPKTIAVGGKGNTYFRCRRCSAQRRRLRKSPEAVAALLRLVNAALPHYLSPDEREDASQSIMLDILCGELSPEGLTPKVMRRYAARSLSMARDRFRFISLSQPTEDGREFGERLAA